MQKHQPALSISPEMLPADEIRGGGVFFQRLKQFWHVMTLLAFGFFLFETLWTARNQLGLQHIALVVLVLVQVGLYFKCFIWARQWPPLRRWLWGHYIGGLLVCVIEQAIAPDFQFLIWTYFGHTFAMIFRPKVALAYMALVNGLFVVTGIYHGHITPNMGNFISFGLTYLVLAAFYLSTYRYSQVSEERATLIEQLQTANAALEQARQRDAEVATLRERERIARDMHDNLGHTLVAMTVQLEAIQRLYKVDAQRGDAQVDQLKQLTRESMAALRRSLDGLRAPGLGQRALPRALHQLSVEVGQRSSLNVRCFVDESASELRHELAEAVWGVAQEALTNIEKHAGAKQAEIELRVSADDVTLRLSDDGVGIPPDVLAQPGKPGHYGLLGMRERVVQLGGTLFVQTKPDARGTHIQVTLPK